MVPLAYLVALAVALMGCEPPSGLQAQPKPSNKATKATAFGLKAIATHTEARATFVVFDAADPKHWYSAGDWRLTEWKGTAPQARHHLFVTRYHLGLSRDGRTLTSDGRRYATKDMGEVASKSGRSKRPRGYVVQDAALDPEALLQVKLWTWRPPRGMPRRGKRGKGYRYAYPNKPTGPVWELELSGPDHATRRALLSPKRGSTMRPRLLTLRDKIVVVAHEGNLIGWQLQAPGSRLFTSAQPKLRVSQARFTHDGKRLAAVGLGGDLVVLSGAGWNKVDSGDIDNADTTRWRALGPHPKHKLVAVGSDDGHIKLVSYGAKGVKEEASLKLAPQQPKGFTRPITTRIDGLHFTPDGKNLIVGAKSAKDTVKIYKLEVSTP